MKALALSYLESDEPWMQSGFSGPEERWNICRKPIADCISRSGTFLDIGCANGYLIECVIKWTKEKNINIVPYGLDISPEIIKLAIKRLPDYKQNFYIGNSLYWAAPQKYDYVRAELTFVPDFLQKKFVNRLLNKFLNPNGKLLIARYRSRNDVIDIDDINKEIRKLSFKVKDYKTGIYEGKELTRICVI